MKEKRTCSSILVIIAASEVGGKEWRVGGGENEMHDNNLVTVKGTGGRGACHQKVD